MHRGLVLLLALAMAGAGCIGSQQDTDDLDPASLPTTAPDLPPGVVALDLTVDPVMGFTTQVVDAAIGYTNDLYEPTMEVSDTGVIYVTGHTILVDTTGAPVFMSKDDGETWEQLPFLGPAQMPAGIHGATPPPSDEIFLTAGDDGQLWGVDITLATFPVNGWCNDGAELCYHNPNAYDEVQANTARADAATGGSCSLLNVNDRPWSAYGDGKLLLVNNAGGGPVQVGLMDVPTMPVGGPGLDQAEPLSADWNLCAGEGGGFIPGIPDMRDDHFFAVPQVQGDELVIVKGHGDVHDVEQVTVFETTSAGPGTSNYGQVVFDAEGTMFVGIRNNTYEEVEREGTFGPTTALEAKEGQLKIAVSQDDGETFVHRTFHVGTPTSSIYMDGNMHGPGALLTWAQEGDDATDWYAAHLTVGADGEPVIENVSLVLDEGPFPSAHVQGAAVGPDGRAHLVMYNGGYDVTDRATPLDVLVQGDGPTLPVTLPTS
ncbi:MAG: hypothetical protein R3185_01830 [Candidatus Thermoplasmatota archaeon]|nr:hypothetical protein [Candidatus Thermoplasmatota archaeon]